MEKGVNLKRKIIMFVILSSLVLVLLACNLSLQKTGLIGQDEEPGVSPSKVPCPNGVDDCPDKGDCRGIVCFDADEDGEPECDWPPHDSGTGCDDGDDCTVGDTCDGSGNCNPSSEKDCEEKPPNLCTADSCDSSGDCQHEYKPKEGCCTKNSDCNDGKKCTIDVCQRDGNCRNRPKPCPICQVCSEKAGGCTSALEHINEAQPTLACVRCDPDEGGWKTDPIQCEGASCSDSPSGCCYDAEKNCCLDANGNCV